MRDGEHAGFAVAGVVVGSFARGLADELHAASATSASSAATRSHGRKARTTTAGS